MKLKATNPLVLFVGALAIGLAGCADDVIITEPPPPPPPPPPPAAEISIGAIVDFESGAEFSTDVVFGRIGVFINFDTGGFEAAALDLLVDGDVFGCQTFSGQAAVGISADVQTVVCSLDTGAGGEACTGQVQRGRFDNGAHTMAARLTLQDGSQVTATRGEDLIFSNSSGIIIVPDDIGMRVVSNSSPGNAGDGVEYWGGPQDLSWFACPILFDDSLTVCEIEISANTAGSSGFVSGTGRLNLGNGEGARASSMEPFTYTAAHRDAADSPVNEDAIEDFGSSSGQTIGNGFSGHRVLDCDGVDVTGSISLTSDVRHLDTTAPMCDDLGGVTGVLPASCDPAIDGMLVDAVGFDNTGLNYSAGAIEMDGLVDGGVGFVVGDFIMGIFEFGDDPPPTGTDVALFTPAVDILQTDPVITEDDGALDADANGVDAYEVDVESAVDLLANLVEDPDSKFGETPNFGVDKTAPVITNLLPPVEDPLFVWNPDTSAPSGDGTGPFETLMFDAEDPDLESGDASMGVDGDGASCGTTCLDEFPAAPNGDLNLVEGAVASSPGGVDDGALLPADDAGTVIAVDPDHNLDFCGSLLALACDGSNDGTYSVDVFVPDRTVKVNNVGTEQFNFILDVSPPLVTFSGVTGLSASNAASVDFDVSGKVVDRNGDGTAVTSAELHVTLADSTGFCDTGNDLITEAAVLISPNDDTTGATVFVDVFAQVNANGGDYTQAFTASNIGPGGGPVTYCFIMRADDGAALKDGTDDGFVGSAFATKDFDWQ